MALYAQSTELNNGEFDTETTEENPKMLAFFDTLVQRDFSDSDSESTLSETESDDIDSVIAKKRNRIKARQSSQDSDYVQNTIQNAREVLMTTTEESETEEDLNSSSPLSKIDSDTEQAIFASRNPSMHGFVFFGFFLLFVYKGRSTLVPIVPKITARWRQMEFCIFCAKSRQKKGVL